jgi:hypothetical protein
MSGRQLKRLDDSSSWHCRYMDASAQPDYICSKITLEIGVPRF